MGAVSTGEIPLLSSFLYLFDGAEAGRRPSPGSFVPRLLYWKVACVAVTSWLARRLICVGDSVRWGVWLGGTSVKR